MLLNKHLNFSEVCNLTLSSVTTLGTLKLNWNKLFTSGNTQLQWTHPQPIQTKKYIDKSGTYKLSRFSLIGTMLTLRFTKFLCF